jgi:hypothetical protein
VQGLPPRVYIHIAGTDDQKRAETVRDALKGRCFLAPGIENIAGGRAVAPNETEIRVFSDEQAALVEAGVIAAAMKDALRLPDAPKVKVIKVSFAVRPRHYEIWFSKPK